MQFISKFVHAGLKIAILILSGLNFSVAQSDSKQPELLGRFSKGDISEFHYRIGQRMLELEPGTKLVVRVCSPHSMSTAIASAAGVSSSAGGPFDLLKLLSSYKVPLDEVYFARYSGCQSPDNGFRTVEYWASPQVNSVMSDEIVKANDVQIKFFHQAQSNEEFKKMLGRVAKQRKLTNFIYVIGAYNKSPSGSLKNNVAIAKEFLSKNRANVRLETLFLGWDRIIDADDRDKEAAYPAFVVVEINR